MSKQTKILVAGPRKVGKSTLMMMFKDGNYAEAVKEGQLSEFPIETEVNGTKVTVQISESSVDARQRLLFLKSMSAVLLCFSFADTGSFDECLAIAKEIQNNNNQTPVILLGLKSECDDKTITQQRMADTQQTYSFITSTFSVSCKNNQGVKEVFKAASEAGLKFANTDSTPESSADKKPVKAAGKEAAPKGKDEGRRGCTVF